MTSDQDTWRGRLFVALVRNIFHTRMGIATLRLTRHLYRNGNENWFDKNRYDLEFSSLPEAFDGYRLVHISDFHLGTWLTHTRFSEVIEAVNVEKPDLVLITGDFITYQAKRFINDITEVLSTLKSKDATLAVLGNHDYWSNAGVVRAGLQACGIIVLCNTVYTIKRNDACLHIAGIDDLMAGNPDIEKVLEELPNASTSILLVHEPDFADISAATGKFDIQFSGHTHGGQIILPRLGPLYLPRYGRKYISGFNRVDQMMIYTTSGIGTAELQFRIGSRPEVAVFTLHTVKSSPNQIGFESDLS